MTVTSIIRIEEQQNTLPEDQSYTAFVSFNHGVRYPCQIHDPFADEMQQEKEWEWYFEEYLTFPFIPKVRARSIAESIRRYSCLFKLINKNADKRNKAKGWGVLVVWKVRQQEAWRRCRKMSRSG